MAKFGTFKFGEALFGIQEVRLSPDLGWASIESMLDPEINPLAVGVDLGDLESTSDATLRYLGPNRPVIVIGETNYRLPTGVIRGLRGHKTKWLYTYYQSGYVNEIRSFTLLLTAPPVEEE